MKTKKARILNKDSLINPDGDPMGEITESIGKNQYHLVHGRNVKGGCQYLRESELDIKI